MRHRIRVLNTKTSKQMNNIYQESVQAVKDGAKFRVDLERRNLTIDGKKIITNGEYEGELGMSLATLDDFLYTVERLYTFYKHSVPSERSESKSRQYFRALPERELSDEDMLYGKHRDPAQIELELYILCQVLLGMEWNEERMGKWFWQSKEDKDLVILKQWIQPGNNPINNK